jgi:hypothetical protein
MKDLDDVNLIVAVERKIGKNRHFPSPFVEFHVAQFPSLVSPEVAMLQAFLEDALHVRERTSQSGVAVLNAPYTCKSAKGTEMGKCHQAETANRRVAHPKSFRSTT